jgi:hypothetical protein
VESPLTAFGGWKERIGFLGVLGVPEVSWISGSPKTTHGDLKPYLFFPSTPKGWLKEGESPPESPPWEGRKTLPLYYRKWGKIVFDKSIT